MNISLQALISYINRLPDSRKNTKHADYMAVTMSIAVPTQALNTPRPVATTVATTVASLSLALALKPPATTPRTSPKNQKTKKA